MSLLSDMSYIKRYKRMCVTYDRTLATALLTRVITIEQQILIPSGKLQLTDVN